MPQAASSTDKGHECLAAGTTTGACSIACRPPRPNWKLSPDQITDRKLKAEAVLGKEQYAVIINKPPAVVGDLILDMYLAQTLAAFPDARAALHVKLGQTK